MRLAPDPRSNRVLPRFLSPTRQVLAVPTLLSSLRNSLLVGKGGAVFSALVLLSGAAQAQTSLVGWDVSTYSAFGASPQAPTTFSPNLTVGGLTRGSGVATTGTAAAGTWGGSEWNAGATLVTTANDAIADGAFATFTITPNAGYKFSLSGISAYNIRRSSSGPQTGQWQYSVDGTSFTNIGSAITWGTTTSSSGNAQVAIDLGAVPALQNVLEGTTVTFRIVNWNASGTGTWYFNNLATAGPDLVINGTVSSVGVDLPPTVVAPFSPADGATGVSIGANLVASFSENIVAISGSTGTIKLYKTSGPELVESFLISSPQVAISANTLTINPTANLTYGTDYYVTIDTGMVEDVTGNDFTGVNLATDWNFTTESAPLPPSVVINKYLNSSPDLVELLVVGTGVTGTTVNLSGMIIKDFSSNMEADSGGKYVFTADPLWSNVPVGTLIVLSKSAVSTDTATAGFNLAIGLDDPVYFTSAGGTFDISTTDMLMIKASTASPAGVTGGIHALAGGTAGSLFTSFTGAKLLSLGTTGTGVAAIAANSTSSISDYSGTDATSSALAASAFGTPSNTENLVYINALRGIIPGDGSGQAFITNATVGPFSGLNIFDDAQTDSQSVKISVTAQVPSVTLTTVEITVPAAMGVPSGASVTGTGAGTPSVSIVSQVVTISGLAVTNTNLVDITLNGLDTPVTTAADNGNQVFTVKTAIAAGTPTSILAQPVTYVIIPIEAIRDVNANGVPLDLNTVVAVEGVCTEAQVFTTNTLAYIQNGNFGVAVFNSNPAGNPFIAGQRFAVVGPVAQFNGVTQVAPSSFANVVNLGAGTGPTPLVITIPNLLLNPEAYEGRLVTVENLSPAVWSAPVSPATSVSVAMQDTASPTPNSLTILITNGSGASTGPGGSANITGIFSQNDGSSPFTSLYQLLPREAGDVDPLVSGFGAWIAGFYPGVTDVNIVGFGADPDGDGIPNGVEALIGGVPNVPGVFGTSDFIKTGNVFTFLYPQDSVVPVGINATYQWSTDMVNWRAGGGSFGGVTVTLADTLWDNSNPEITVYQVTATVTAGTAAKLFVRVGAAD